MAQAETSYLGSYPGVAMSDAVIAAKVPAAVELEAGAYFWCACGKAEPQPFCTGAHKGSGLFPQKFEIAEKKTVYLCQCKQSKNPPFCDGAHRAL